MNPKKIPILILFYFLVGYFTLLVPINLEANRIYVLNTKLTGDRDKLREITGSLNMNHEFSKLSGELISKNFFSEVKIQSPHSNISKKSDYSLLCLEQKVHYVLETEINFFKGSQSRFYSGLFNCAMGTERKKSSPLSDFVIDSMEKHYQNLFIFLPKREKQTNPTSENDIQEIGMFLDSAGVFSLEKPVWEDWNHKLIHSSSPKYIFYYLNRNKRWIPNGSTQSIPVSGKSDTSVLIQHLGKFMTSSRRGSARVNFLMISSPHFHSGMALVDSINRYRDYNNRNYILQPFHATFSEIEKLRRVARSTQSPILKTSYIQKVGLSDGTIYYLFLRDGYLYSLREKPSRKVLLNQEDSLSYQHRFAVEDRFSPYSMDTFFSSKTNLKLIQKEQAYTNLSLLVETEIQKIQDPNAGYGKRVLVKAHKNAHWISISPEDRIDLNRRYILETVFYKNDKSSTGIVNDSKRTKIHSPNHSYPKLMEYNLLEIKPLMNKYNLTELKVYLPVSIEEID